MKNGTYTAIITPFNGDRVDYDGLDQLVRFQIENNISGVLAVGTTGESPTLSWEEHHKVTRAVAEGTRSKCMCIAGTGSNNTREALSATEHAVQCGVDAVLLVDPYYNGPSSMEIRKEYIAPVAAQFPDLPIIPYVIPGRTGAQLLPADLALLSREFPNVQTVKEATGNIDNMRSTRALCGLEFAIFSGDDGMTHQMMTDPKVGAAGVISVISNVAPRAVGEMVAFLDQGNIAEADRLKTALDPLFKLVVVSTTEKTPVGDALFRARNPLPVKTLMAILGMPSGGCRQPLGKMTRQSLEVVLGAARTVQQQNPEVFKPIETFFKVNIEQRLDQPENISELIYPDY
ncbi:MAG: 4-hydroxy-tetrahydrodipicolinate synthase [Desulfobacteraceae bacterium]|nr:4-hydroxy-tetrahydrodipicolinate synthase [Desulfobacteraceae bacterium]